MSGVWIDYRVCCNEFRGCGHDECNAGYGESHDAACPEAKREITEDLQKAFTELLQNGISARMIVAALLNSVSQSGSATAKDSQCLEIVGKLFELME